jgi:hypothetical protein
MTAHKFHVKLMNPTWWIHSICRKSSTQQKLNWYLNSYHIIPYHRSEPSTRPTFLFSCSNISFSKIESHTECIKRIHIERDITDSNMNFQISCNGRKRHTFLQCFIDKVLFAFGCFLYSNPYCLFIFMIHRKM